MLRFLILCLALTTAGGAAAQRCDYRQPPPSPAMTEAVIKELKGTTGRRIVRGILGSLFKGR